MYDTKNAHRRFWLVLQTQQQISANSQHLKRSVLTASQLDKLSDETLMFEAAGKA